jgi:hypothetical protein
MMAHAASPSGSMQLGKEINVDLHLVKIFNLAFN